MKFYISMYQIIKDKVSSLKHMEELLEDIMLDKRLHRRSYEMGYGGQLCTNIPSNIVGHVMSVRGMGSCCEEMNYL